VTGGWEKREQPFSNNLCEFVGLAEGFGSFKVLLSFLFSGSDNASFNSFGEFWGG